MSLLVSIFYREKQVSAATAGGIGCTVSLAGMADHPDVLSTTLSLKLVVKWPDRQRDDYFSQNDTLTATTANFTELERSVRSDLGPE